MARLSLDSPAATKRQPAANNGSANRGTTINKYYVKLAGIPEAMMVYISTCPYDDSVMKASVEVYQKLMEFYRDVGIADFVRHALAKNDQMFQDFRCTTQIMRHRSYPSDFPTGFFIKGNKDDVRECLSWLKSRFYHECWELKNSVLPMGNDAQTIYTIHATGLSRELTQKVISILAAADVTVTMAADEPNTYFVNA